jgi:hypothetical protein
MLLMESPLQIKEQGCGEQPFRELPYPLRYFKPWDRVRQGTKRDYLVEGHFREPSI